MYRRLLLSLLVWIVLVARVDAQQIDNSNTGDDAGSASGAPSDGSFSDFQLGTTGEIDQELRLIEDPDQQQTQPSAANAARGFGNQGAFNFFNAINQLNQANNFNQREALRVPIKLGFAYAGAPPARVSSQLQTRLARLPQFARNSQVVVEMEQRTAVLKGNVATEDQRRLVERLALLEPGVSKVRNELTLSAVPEELPRP